VTNECHENSDDHHYVVSIDDVTEDLVACTCLHHIRWNVFCKHMAAVENATDGTLNAFPSEDDNDAELETATAMASVASRAGHACERDGKNCRTNHRFSPFYPWHAN
jgi:hypothetical protein